MSFIDEARIHVKAGDGGDGCSSFKREKFIEFGGPDGGNGGSGGSVFFVASAEVNTLLYFRYHQHIRAENGKQGSGRNRSGRSGSNLTIKVPLGTELYDAIDGDLLADMKEVNQQYLVATGGKGGVGNTQYKSSTNRAPRYYTEGEKGEERSLYLKLKVISDVGIVGMPNSGKSKLLSRCTMSKTKVGDYPFTTLEPHLGVAYVMGEEIVLADIPGLVANASQGAGMGHRFLRHIERCVLLLHLVDCSLEDVVESYRCISQELSLYSEELALKPEVVILNKCDLLNKQDIEAKKHNLERYTKKEVYVLSAQDNVHPLLKMLYSHLQECRPPKLKDAFDPYPK